MILFEAAGDVLAAEGGKPLLPLLLDALNQDLPGDLQIQCQLGLAISDFLPMSPPDHNTNSKVGLVFGGQVRWRKSLVRAREDSNPQPSDPKFFNVGSPIRA